MKKGILVILAIMYCFSTFAQIKRVNPREHKVNFGIKGGFNSSMYFVDEFKIQDVTIDEIQNNYKVGYFGAMFIRINIKRHFIQPELHYTLSKCEIEFDKRGSQHPAIKPDYAFINATIRTVELPLLYGYNFVKAYPYGMYFFVGPKVKYVWTQKSKLEFNNFDRSGISEDLYPVNLSAVAGIGVTISNIFFDFSYEIGLHNISRSVIYESPGGSKESTSDMTIKRRNNILNFSLGVIF